MFVITIATTNTGKIDELNRAGTGSIQFVPPEADLPELEEGTTSLRENARAKARAAARHLNRPVIADDTGFFVDALNGQPGVMSARFGDVDDDAGRCRLILERLAGLGTNVSRSARYETVLVVTATDGRMLESVAAVHGSVTTQPCGDRGFGYDSIFAPAAGGGLTFAEMTADDKARLSQRTEAVRNLLDANAELLAAILYD